MIKEYDKVYIRNDKSEIWTVMNNDGYRVQITTLGHIAFVRATDLSLV